MVTKTPIAGGSLSLRKSLPVLFTLAGLGLVVALLWMIRPWFHGLLMLFYQYPLVTWMPVVAFGLGTAVLTALFKPLMRRGDAVDAAYVAVWISGILVCIAWVVCMIFLPSWQGRALYQATEYQMATSLPHSTQPRLLPKGAAEEYGEREDIKHAHLVVEPSSGQLVWSGERSPGGLFRRGNSAGIAVQPLDQIEGRMEARSAGFTPSVSRLGPGSLKWKAYKANYWTRVQDRIIVPLQDGGTVAMAPYVGYRGFFIKRPYLKGVYVYHADGTMEDLSPEEALKRPELARSGRIFPENLARDIAEAYGYNNGIMNTVSGHRGETIVSDDYGDNPQPYLTNLGDGRVAWVTTAHPHGQDSINSAVFLTDAATGRTSVHKPSEVLLSNQGAKRLAETLPLTWTQRVCCDEDGYEYDHPIRWTAEPRPVFKDGKFYFLVSIVADRDYVAMREPVEQTVLIDAQEQEIVKVFNHQKDRNAGSELRQFFLN